MAPGSKKILVTNFEKSSWPECQLSSNNSIFTSLQKIDINESDLPLPTGIKAEASKNPSTVLLSRRLLQGEERGASVQDSDLHKIRTRAQATKSLRHFGTIPEATPRSEDISAPITPMLATISKSIPYWSHPRLRHGLSAAATCNAPIPRVQRRYCDVYT